MVKRAVEVGFDVVEVHNARGLSAAGVFEPREQSADGRVWGQLGESVGVDAGGSGGGAQGDA